MRVVFVYPCFENLGLEYLSAVLKADGVETSLVFDPLLFDDPFLSAPRLARHFNWTSSVPRRVIERQPDLVAFGVLASNYNWALDLATRIKALRDVPVLFGGTHAMAVPEVVMENGQVDYCVVGEGEGPLRELCRCLDQGRDLAQVPSLVWRRDGLVVRNPLGPLLSDLDSLPFPDKELFYREVPAFRRHYTLLTRRGCAHSCAYCHNTSWARLYPGGAGQVRLRTVDNVMDELSQALSRYGYQRVRINDDLFSHDTDWLLEFCRRYGREIRRPFMCSCSPADLTDAVVGELKAAGCFQVCLGVQAVQERVRREHFYRFTPQNQVEEALASLRRHRLRATVDNILGWQGQELADIEEMARFYLDHPVYGRFTVFWLIYFAGTAITEQAVERGLIDGAAASQLGQRPPTQANTLMGERWTDDTLRSMHLLLLLVQILPRSLGRALLDSGLYRHLPAANPSLVEGVWTLFTRDRLDPVRQRYWAKYRQYGPRALLGQGRP